MPNPSVQPYLFFGGRCEEALAFYRSALGAEVKLLMRYSESPEPPPPGRLQPGFESKVMHAEFRIREAILYASDGCDDQSAFQGFSLTLNLPSPSEADRAFAALAVGGSIQMPLSRTFWSACFGMLTDRFGLGWMVSIAPSEGA